MKSTGRFPMGFVSSPKVAHGTTQAGLGQEPSSSASRLFRSLDKIRGEKVKFLASLVGVCTLTALALAKNKSFFGDAAPRAITSLTVPGGRGRVRRRRLGVFFADCLQGGSLYEQIHTAFA